MGFPQHYSGSVSELVERIHSGETAEKCTRLNFNEKGIGDSRVSQLCTVLNHFTALQELWLDRNSISSAGVSVLCDILPQCTQLTDLTLDKNSIDDIGAKRIAETLKRTKLQHLDIGGNDIGRNGISALLLSAANSQTLRQLSIEGNSGLENSVADIVDILPHCNTLRRLYVGYRVYSVSEEFRQRILSALQNCTLELKVWFSGEDVVSGTKKRGATTEPLDRSVLDAIERRIAALPTPSRSSTPIVDPLFGEISRSTAFQRVFLTAVDEDGLVVHRRRVALLGDSGVGKTWTAKSLRREENIEPANDVERIKERTAAAESSALCASDIVVADKKRSIDHVKSPSTVPVTHSNVSTTSERRSRDPEAVHSGRSSEAFEFHDIVHNFTFPPGLLEELDLDGQNTVCYLNLWDFGGQRMYHSWYQFFFAPGMIPCVVFDMSALMQKDEDASSSKVSETVQRVVEYAQQSAHFGGSGSRVLLVGTQVDKVASTPSERERLTKDVQKILLGASPEHVHGRYYQFSNADRSVGDTTPGTVQRTFVCDVSNSRSSNTGLMDPGVTMLKTSLIRECLRDRSVGEPEPVDDVQKVQSYLHRNIVPRRWYKFELELRNQWGSRNFAPVAEVREFARVKIGGEVDDVDEELDFIGMLTSMAAAGSVVLTKEVRWGNEEAFVGDCEALMKSVVVLRPQWLIEVGRRILPRPYEERDEYSFRLLGELDGLNDNAGGSIRRLWSSALVQRDLLYRITMGKVRGLEREFEDMLRLFEERLILCPLSSTPDTKRTTLWFLPSMVAFHAEHPTGLPSKIVKRSPTAVCTTLEFEWVPPGLPMLIVGALLHGMEGRPKFSVTPGNALVQFSVELREFVDNVYIDLPKGIGGNVVSVWTERWLPMKEPVERLMRKVLHALCHASTTLRVKPLLSDPAYTIERGLLLKKFTVPLMMSPDSASSGSYELSSVCLKDIPNDCDKEETSLLYRRVLKDYESKVFVQGRWLGKSQSGNVDPSDVPSTQPAVTPNVTAESSGTADSDPLVEEMTPAARTRLGRRLVRGGKWIMWDAAALLGLEQEDIKAETTGSELRGYAHTILLRCLHMRKSEILDAIKEATAPSDSE